MCNENINKYTFLLISCCKSGQSFLQLPEPITKEEVEKLTLESRDMNFIFGESFYLSFKGTRNGTEHTIGANEGFYAKIDSPAGFVKQDDFYIKCHGPCIVPAAFKAKEPSPNKTKGKNESSAYFLSKARVFEKPNPKRIDFTSLVSILKERKHIFYTGAGISAGVVPTMTDLEKQIGFSKIQGDDIIDFAKNAVSKFEKNVEFMDNLFNSMNFGKPTKAHLVLKELAVFQKTSIITENLDLLQHRTGVKPIGPPYPNIIKPHYRVDDIKYVICIGLSYDDRGFLSWVIESNPRVRIISIDLGVPSYLSDKDFLYHGDLQALLPKLMEVFLAKRRD